MELFEPQPIVENQISGAQFPAGKVELPNVQLSDAQPFGLYSTTLSGPWNANLTLNSRTQTDLVELRL
jgi:hypothetical protein